MAEYNLTFQVDIRLE